MKTRYELWEYSESVSRCIAIRQSHEVDKKWHMPVGNSQLIARYTDGKEHVLHRIK